ncbi:DUF5953 family protein [Corallococcus sp. RDP092CA]|uniref:DUF5953 family protein n=1 Tax=Corallococcus sp. RDP092CA TaxID=3109369 RepID=UPI0035AF2A9D
MLSIKVYGPALKGDDPRPLAVVRAVERSLPDLRLEWAVAEDHQVHHVSQRAEWLARAQNSGGFPMLCNNDEHWPVTVFGLGLSANSGPGGKALFEVQVELPMTEPVLAAAADLLGAVAVSANAFWGHATPFGASVEISGQTVHPHEPGSPPRGLPALKAPAQIHSPELPHRIGWLNYWSEATSRAIGLPESARDVGWISRPLEGGWLVQLTEAPLDLERPEHLASLRHAYERFPAIGGQSK